MEKYYTNYGNNYPKIKLHFWFLILLVPLIKILLLLFGFCIDFEFFTSFPICLCLIVIQSSYSWNGPIRLHMPSV